MMYKHRKGYLTQAQDLPLVSSTLFILLYGSLFWAQGFGDLCLVPCRRGRLCVTISPFFLHFICFLNQATGGSLELSINPACYLLFPGLLASWTVLESVSCCPWLLPRTTFSSVQVAQQPGWLPCLYHPFLLLLLSWQMHLS